MKGRTVLTFVVVASLMIVGAAGSATAHPNAGASGNCDEDQEKDGPVIEISESPDLTDQEEVQTTINELALFFQNKANDPQGENACDGEEGDDYIEAHASGGGQGVQVCYSDGNDQGSPSQDNIKQGHSDPGYCS